MDFVADFFLVLAVAFFLLMLGGLYKPWVMLWWQETQNRKKVIRLYGSAGLFFLVLYLLLR